LLDFKGIILSGLKAGESHWELTRIIGGTDPKAHSAQWRNWFLELGLGGKKTKEFVWDGTLCGIGRRGLWKAILKMKR